MTNKRRDRCKHQWEIAGMHYRAPASELKFRGFGDNGTLDLLILGFTTVSLICSECGDVATRQVKGRFVKPNKPAEEVAS